MAESKVAVGKEVKCSCMSSLVVEWKTTDLEMFAQEDKGLVRKCELHKVVHCLVPAACVEQMLTARCGACHFAQQAREVAHTYIPGCHRFDMHHHDRVH